jgi:hypothetical protein
MLTKATYPEQQDGRDEELLLAVAKAQHAGAI